jgi:hypothetical protein
VLASSAARAEVHRNHLSGGDGSIRAGRRRAQFGHEEMLDDGLYNIDNLS